MGFLRWCLRGFRNHPQYDPCQPLNRNKQKWEKCVPTTNMKKDTSDRDPIAVKSKVAMARNSRSVVTWKPWQSSTCFSLKWGICRSLRALAPGTGHRKAEKTGEKGIHERKKRPQKTAPCLVSPVFSSKKLHRAWFLFFFSSKRLQQARFLFLCSSKSLQHARFLVFLQLQKAATQLVSSSSTPNNCIMVSVCFFYSKRLQHARCLFVPAPKACNMLGFWFFSSSKRLQHTWCFFSSKQLHHGFCVFFSSNRLQHARCLFVPAPKACSSNRLQHARCLFFPAPNNCNMLGFWAKTATCSAQLVQCLDSGP